MSLQAFFETDRSGLSRLGDRIFVGVPVRPVPGARVLWLNMRWFLEMGVDVTQPRVRAAAEEELLSRFAVAASGEGEAGSGPGGMRADRYGASMGSRHGGSGRAGIRGGFNAKGIGRTPLVSKTAEFSYSSGRLWVGEALREAILSEVAGSELPFGAIPTLAIIDAGFAPTENPGESRRAAIIVRPNFVRPAHFERSVYFGTAGTPGSDQYEDALRVADAVEAAASDESLGLSGPDSVEAMFQRFAGQIGEARAHRLWQGRFLTSNVSTSGATVDFGSFRSVPNWCSAIGLPGEKFGSDTVHLHVAAQSLCHYFRRYAPDRYARLDPIRLASGLERSINRAFLQACMTALGLDRAAPMLRMRAEAALWRYYKAQQRTAHVAESAEAKAHPWIHAALAGDAAALGRAPGEEESAARAVLDCLESVAKDDPLSALAARRWLMPRPRLYYDESSAAALAVERALTGEEGRDRAAIGDFIRLEVSRSRRVWRNLDPSLKVVGQADHLHSSALFCRGKGDSSSLVLTGPVLGGELLLFGARVPLDRVETARLPRTAGRAEVTVGIPEAALGESTGIELGGAVVEVPAADLTFRDADAASRPGSAPAGAT